MAEFRWTSEQAAVLVEQGDVLLSANAGTGKTRTIVGKIAWLLGLDVGPGPDGLPLPRCPDPCALEDVAAITFTEKAATELKDRLRRQIEETQGGDRFRWDLDHAAIGTIHAFCAGLLRDHALRLGIDPTFRVLDERETALRLNEIIHGVVMGAVREGDPDVDRLLQRFRLYDAGYATGLIGSVASVVREIRWHADLYEEWMTPADARDERRLDVDRLLALCLEELGEEPDEEDVSGIALAAGLHRLARRSVRDWLEWLERENTRDFDSLILDVRRLLTRPEHRSALVSIRRQLRILVIDEFQDTDGAQRDIAFALAGIGERNAGPTPQLVLVGDPKQSIYGFRGADVTVWNDVRRVLCGSSPPLELTENFRTQPGVVSFINRAASGALQSAADGLEPYDPELRVEYSPLLPHRPAGPGEGVDWLDTSAGATSAERRRLEARLVASRIRGLLRDGRLPDPGSPEGSRSVRRADIAVLARRRRSLEGVESALLEAGIETYNAASLGLTARQEILDLVTVLRLIADPEDDYHAFAFLRSPFVGLRDEVIARFRLDPTSRGGPLLKQAAVFLAAVEEGRAGWFDAPEHREITAVEKEALSRALAALDDAQRLADRAETSALLEDVVRRTSYRLHLLLRPAADEALAGMERFAALLDEYRHMSLRAFLDLWDRWGDQDLGIPQAPLYSAADDVVTLQTVHTAKGLEWPVVIFVGTADAPRDRSSGEYRTDPRVGPVLMPSKSNRGPRCRAIADRLLAAERAEEARLLYVALTRARDRLVIAGPDDPTGYMEFMLPVLREAVPAHLAPEAPARSSRRPPPRARAEDPVTRTGGQIEVFDDGHEGQLDIFRHAAPEPPVTPGAPLRPVVYREPEPEQESLGRIPISLSWMDGLTEGEAPRMARPVDVPLERSLTSATEMQMRERDPDAWKLRYVHGVEETWRFVPTAATSGALPPTLRGTLIHGVLERIEAVEELSRLLNETIADVDAPPGAEDLLEPGAAYRAALEAEIARVVTGSRWRWYVDGPHHRELPFVVFGGGRPWRAGAIDLYRPGEEEDWIVDFKTHEIPAEDAARIARDYAVQAAVYQGAAAALTGRTPRLVLHFTHPDEAVEL